jgi:hypothetical protein
VKHLLSGLAVCGVCGGRMRVQKNRGFLAYLCVEGFHVSRREDYADAVVVGAVLRRLIRPDLSEVLAGDEGEDSEAAEALTEAREKRARLEGFYDAAAAGELSPAALSRIEARLLPEIEQAEERSRRTGLPPIVGDVAGPDAAEKWDRLSIAQKREVVSALCRVEIRKSGTAGKFDPGSIFVIFYGSDGAEDETEAVALSLGDGGSGGGELLGVSVNRDPNASGDRGGGGHVPDVCEGAAGCSRDPAGTTDTPRQSSRWGLVAGPEPALGFSVADPVTER